MRFSIIVPVLNESATIRENLLALQRHRDDQCEVIVVDGGSIDGTYSLCDGLCDSLLRSDPGRAKQMNIGAGVSKGEILIFLHADTHLPRGFKSILNSFDDTKNGDDFFWGRFNVSLSGRFFMFRIIESLMNSRSRLTGIATGDQAIFVSRKLFDSVGGFPDIPLMEDVQMSLVLKKIVSPLCVKDRVRTSSRRWEKNGIFRTIFLMWRLRFEFFCGVDPVVLAKKYR